MIGGWCVFRLTKVSQKLKDRFATYHGGDANQIENEWKALCNHPETMRRSCRRTGIFMIAVPVAHNDQVAYVSDEGANNTNN